MHDVGAHLIFTRVIRKIIELYRTMHGSKGRQLIHICSRSEVTVTHCRELVDNLLHLTLEAQLQAFIKLIDNKRRDSRSIDITLLQMVIEPSGRTDNNRRLQALHRTMLVHRRTASIHAHRLPWQSHILQHGLNLQSQLARRHNHHSLHACDTLFQALYKRKQVGQSLTGTRRGKKYYIVLLASRL